MPAIIRAAGGVLWRETDGLRQVGLVHRPRYDDWTLPKGKLHRTESELAGAVREVAEETGARVAVSRRLPTTEYLYQGRPKTVSYWAMRALGGEFQPGTEVDDFVWVSAREAAERLSYDGDRRVLHAFVLSAMPDAVVVLVRHARAGKRTAWDGPDHLRPLDSSGRDQARALARFLPFFGPDRIMSADRTRCVQTVDPLAEACGLPVEVAPEFSDEAFEEDPQRALRDLLGLAKAGTCTIVCSQGGAIPGLLDMLDSRLPARPTRKGAAWVLSFSDGILSGADHYPDAAR